MDNIDMSLSAFFGMWTGSIFFAKSILLVPFPRLLVRKSKTRKKEK
jgi:hypothetical protein